MPQPDNSLTTTVYRKPTHRSVLGSQTVTTTWLLTVVSLTHRAMTVCFSPQLLMKEEDYLKGTLQKCRYLIWALNRANIKDNKSNRPNEGPNNIWNNPASNNKKPHTVVPYTIGLSESCKNICCKYDIQMHFRGGTAIKDLLVNPRDRDSILQKRRVKYR